EGQPAHRFTPAGPDHAQIASANGVIDDMEAGADRHGLGGDPAATGAAAVRKLFRDHETALLQPLLDYLAGHPRFRLIGRRRAPERAPTVAFTVDGHRSSTVARRLSDFNLGVGVGNFYAYRLVKALGTDPD